MDGHVFAFPNFDQSCKTKFDVETFLRVRTLEKLKSLSAFFPAYNEEANVERMVDAFRPVLPQVAEDYEIIIVNDGSKDKTREIADRLIKEDQKGSCRSP